jgi:hypothetical protein
MPTTRKETVFRYHVLVDDTPMFMSNCLPLADHIARFHQAANMAETYRDINPHSKITIEIDKLEPERAKERSSHAARLG